MAITTKVLKKPERTVKDQLYVPAILDGLGLTIKVQRLHPAPGPEIERRAHRLADGPRRRRRGGAADPQHMVLAHGRAGRDLGEVGGDPPAAGVGGIRTHVDERNDRIARTQRAVRPAEPMAAEVQFRWQRQSALPRCDDCDRKAAAAAAASMKSRAFGRTRACRGFTESSGHLHDTREQRALPFVEPKATRDR